MSKIDRSIIELDYPIMVDGTEVKTVSLRRPKVRDLIAAAKGNRGNEERELSLIANLAEMSPQDLEELDVKDYAKAQKTLSDFFGVK